MKEKMAKLKDNKDMSSTEKIKYVAVLWKSKERRGKSGKNQKKTKK
jgi:hypothetical protein